MTTYVTSYPDDIDMRLAFIGIWYIIHTEGIKAKSNNDKAFYRKLILHIIDSMRCSKCKEHMKLFLKQNPFSKYENIKYKGHKNIGYFIWGWELHNNVNDRLNKPKMDLLRAIELYSNNEECEDCIISKLKR